MDPTKTTLADAYKILWNNPQSAEAKEIFLNVLEILPAAPNIPGLQVFCALGEKMVPYFVDMALVRDGKVLLTYRSDPYYKGLAFPGFMRTPKCDLLEDCNNKAQREFGDVRILSIDHPIRTFDQPDCPRFHHASNLQLITKFEGEPKGQWFDTIPENIIPIHVRYWEFVRPFLKAA